MWLTWNSCSLVGLRNKTRIRLDLSYVTKKYVFLRFDTGHEEQSLGESLAVSDPSDHPTYSIGRPFLSLYYITWLPPVLRKATNTIGHLLTIGRNKLPPQTTYTSVFSGEDGLEIILMSYATESSSAHLVRPPKLLKRANIELLFFKHHHLPFLTQWKPKLTSHFFI